MAFSRGNHGSYTSHYFPPAGPLLPVSLSLSHVWLRPNDLQCDTLFKPFYVHTYVSPFSRLHLLNSVHWVHITTQNSARILPFPWSLLWTHSVWCNCPTGGSHWICFSFLTLYYNFMVAFSPFPGLWTPWRNQPLSYSCFSSTKSCAWYILVDTW